MTDGFKMGQAMLGGLTDWGKGAGLFLSKARFSSRSAHAYLDFLGKADFLKSFPCWAMESMEHGAAGVLWVPCFGFPLSAKKQELKQAQAETERLRPWG